MKPHLAGTANGRAVLTVDTVLELYVTEGTHKALAKRFGVSPAQVGKIKRGQSWSSVTQSIPKSFKDSSTIQGTG